MKQQDSVTMETTHRTLVNQETSALKAAVGPCRHGHSGGSCKDTQDPLPTPSMHLQH